MSVLLYTEEKVSIKMKKDDPDSDSSPLPSLDDEQNSETVQTKQDKQDNKKKKTMRKEEGAKDKKVSP